jgi:two-component system cell cycle sensor histidine kinase/response regulator CckA
MPMETVAVRRVSVPVKFGTVEPTEARRTVLLVNGDEDLRAVTARVLTREGYHVITASHSGHALLASLISRIDILISELELDETSGPTLAATLRQHHPRLRAVYFADAGTPAGVGLVVRPFTRDDLVLELSAADVLPTSAS